MRSSGAGAGAQNVMGTGVFFGMLVATAVGVFIIPGNYTFVESILKRKKKVEPGVEAGEVLPPPLPAGGGGGHS
jgi:HAE1 family hydrophobic/amphiphilic exporter-1